MDHTELCIETSKSLQDALQQLNETGKKILLVMNNKRLEGTLTDGDVRRYLLSGGALTDSVCNAANIHPQTAANREQAGTMLRTTGQTAIPVVSPDGTLLDVVLAIKKAKPVCSKLQLPVVIMAGGRGTRLDPYTRVLPKPLIPVGELPIIEHIMQQFELYACKDFHLIVNHKKQLIKAYFGENEQHYQVNWYDEERPLGTGGGLSLLKGKIQQTFFLTNCDILLQSNYSNILQFHRKNGNMITMVGAYKKLTIPYGVLEIGENGVMEGIREKPEMSFLTNTGMYLVEPEVLADIPDNTPMGFPDIIETQRQKGRKVAVYPVDEEEWLDMGQLSELENMRNRLERNADF